MRKKKETRPPPHYDPPQRLVLITGVTRGIGRALAIEFAKIGHIVVGCGTTPELIESLRQELARPHSFDTVDITADKQVRAWAGRVLRSHGAPDLLVNNAGRVHKRAKVWEIEPAEFDAVISVNVRGPANVMRHFVPAMIANQRGVIVNISSTWGRSAEMLLGAYSASKWAIEALTKAVALGLPLGFACVAYNPGVIQTEMQKKAWGGGENPYPTPELWARWNAPWMLRIGSHDNGRSLDGLAGPAQFHGEAGHGHPRPKELEERERNS